MTALRTIELRAAARSLRRHGGAVALTLVTLCLAPLVVPLLSNGDAAVYNDQIERGDLAVRTVHFGYLLLGRALHLLLPGETDWQMNVMTLLVGLAGVLAVYAIGFALTSSTLAGFAAGCATLGIPAYLAGMLASEVDVPLAAFVALAFACWLAGRDKTAAALFGYAMLVSPLASLALPAFLVAPSTRSVDQGRLPGLRKQARRILIFAALSLTVYLPVVLYHHHDYLEGGRGLLHAPRTDYSLGTQLTRSGSFFAREVWVTVLIGGGILVGLARGLYAQIAGILLVVVASALFGERFTDVPVQLTSTTLGTGLVALLLNTAWVAAWQRAGLRRALGIGALLLTTGGLVVADVSSYRSARSLVRKLGRERRRLVEMKATFPDELVLVNSSGFGESRVFERTLFGRTHGNNVLSLRAFRGSCAELASERRTYWLARSPYDIPCSELAEHYDAVVRRIAGARLHFLVPKAPVTPGGPTP